MLALLSVASVISAAGAPAVATVFVALAFVTTLILKDLNAADVQIYS